MDVGVSINLIRKDLYSDEKKKFGKKCQKTKEL